METPMRQSLPTWPLQCWLNSPPGSTDLLDIYNVFGRCQLHWPRFDRSICQCRAPHILSIPARFPPLQDCNQSSPECRPREGTPLQGLPSFSMSSLDWDSDGMTAHLPFLWFTAGACHLFLSRFPRFSASKYHIWNAWILHPENCHCI